MAADSSLTPLGEKFARRLRGRHQNAHQIKPLENKEKLFLNCLRLCSLIMAEDTKDKFSYLNRGVYCAYPEPRRSETARLYAVVRDGQEIGDARAFFYLDEREGNGFIKYGDDGWNRKTYVGFARMDYEDGKPVIILNLPVEMVFEGKRVSAFAVLDDPQGGNNLQEAVMARPIDDPALMPRDLVVGTGGICVRPQLLARLHEFRP